MLVKGALSAALKSSSHSKGSIGTLLWFDNKSSFQQTPRVMPGLKALALLVCPDSRDLIIHHSTIGEALTD